MPGSEFLTRYFSISFIWILAAIVFGLLLLDFLIFAFIEDTCYKAKTVIR